MTVDVELHHDFAGFALDVAFSVAETGVTALFGPSGAGKSTTVDAIAGLLRPQRGRIVVNGHTLLDTAAGIDVAPRRRRIGYVFQDGRLFPHLTVRENLLFGWRRARQRADSTQIAALIETLGIGHLLQRRPAALSGGERQRIALGRALLMHPDALLLDEPLAALDRPRKAEILPYLERLSETADIPVIYVSHAIEEVARLADQIVVLDAGRVVAHGSVFDVTSRLDLATLGADFEPGAVLSATVRRHDRRDGLTELELPGGELIVPLLDHAPGERVRVRIAARDVMLSLDEPANISANNVIAATVTAITSEPGPTADVQLAFGTSRLIARLTRRSIERLALTAGRKVHALIKTVTVDRRSSAPDA